MSHIDGDKDTIFQVGDFIRNGEFQVKEIIGGWRGYGGVLSGMGIVYICTKIPFGKESIPIGETQIFAIKTFQARFRDDIDIKSTFENEIRNWMALEHPNIVRILYSFYEYNQYFIVMEYVGSVMKSFRNSLQAHLTGEPFSLSQAIEWGVQICQGMDYANKNGITCHQDLKPGNILINFEGQIKICDFGLANAAEKTFDLKIAQDISTLSRQGIFSLIKTKNGFLCGTPGYIAPERLDGKKDIDIRSDIYSFGIILYQMITGQRTPPFIKPPNTIELKRLIREIDSPLGNTILQCLELNPSKRYANFEELGTHLKAIGSKEGCIPLGVVEEDIKKYLKSKIILSGKEIGGLALWFLKSDPLKRFTTEDEAGTYIFEIFDGVSDSGSRSLINPIKLLASDWNNKGTTHNSLGEIQEALHCFDEALKIDYTYGPALSNKGLTLLDIGKSQEALDCFTRAVEYNYKESVYWYNLGMTLERLGEYRQAISKYDQAITLFPKDYDSWNQKGICLGELGLYDEAVEWFDLMAKRFNSPAPLNAKGLMFEKLGNYQKALDCYNESLTIDSKYDTAMYSKAIVLTEIGRLDEAVDCFKIVIKLNPNRFWAWLRMAKALNMMGNQKNAIKAFKQFILEAPEGCEKEIDDVKKQIELLEKQGF